MGYRVGDRVRVTTNFFGPEIKGLKATVIPRPPDWGGATWLMLKFDGPVMPMHDTYGDGPLIRRFHPDYLEKLPSTKPTFLSWCTKMKGQA